MISPRWRGPFAAYQLARPAHEPAGDAVPADAGLVHAHMSEPR